MFVIILWLTPLLLIQALLLITLWSFQLSFMQDKWLQARGRTWTRILNWSTSSVSYLSSTNSNSFSGHYDLRPSWTINPPGGYLLDSTVTKIANTSVRIGSTVLVTPTWPWWDGRSSAPLLLYLLWVNPRLFCLVVLLTSGVWWQVLIAWITTFGALKYNMYQGYVAATTNILRGDPAVPLLRSGTLCQGLPEGS